MPLTAPAPSDAAASLLAMVVSANGRIDDREVAALDRLQAYGRVGMGRDDFLALAESALQDMGRPLSQNQYLRLSDRSRLLGLQMAITDPGMRLTVCRLASAVIHADGRVTRDEHLVYSSLLAQWRVTDTMVAHACMRDTGH